jgi:nicotinamide riboside transporter PnuC
MSWLLTFYSLLGVWLIGRKNIAGWLVGLSCQLLWLFYAITTKQYGFVVSAVVFGWVYVINYLKWKNEEEDGHERH